MTAQSQTINGYTIDLRQRTDIGSVWTVRTYKRILGFKRLISSDWFLNREQADIFATQLAAELQHGAGLITQRHPGWVLRRPAR